MKTLPSPPTKRRRADHRPTLTRPQFEIYRHGWKPEARFRTAVCGRRFGKTFVAVEEIRRACRMAVRNKVSTRNQIWYGGPTLDNAVSNFWVPLKEGIPKRWVRKINEARHTITLTSGHVIRIVGMLGHDRRRGAGLYFFLGDEWQDCDPQAWEATIRPMLSTAQGHALFIGTPKGFNQLCDFYQEGQEASETRKPGRMSWTYTTLQGGNVPCEEVAEARSTLDPRTFRQEYEASFESYEGRVLFAFSRAGNVKACRDKLTPTSNISIGIDFNVNPMSATVLVEEGEVAYQVDEIVMPTSNTDELVAEIRRRLARNGSLGHVTAYPDPAGAQRRTSAQGRTDIGILQASGMRVVAMSSHPLVRDRNNVTNARFTAADGSRRLFVDPHCRKSIEAYERHAYREGTSEPDKSAGFDHVCDALGYWAFGRFAYKPPQQRTVNVLGR